MSERKPLTPVIVNLYVGPVGPFPKDVTYKDACIQFLDELMAKMQRKLPDA